MHMRNKVVAIEAVVVLLMLIIFAFVVFLLIDAGTNAYGKILDQNQRTQSARVACSYIAAKLHQNDTESGVDVVETQYGSTLKINMADTDFCTYIFYSEGVLYECLAQGDNPPAVSAANKITALGGFEVVKNARRIRATFGCGADTIACTVGLRT